VTPNISQYARFTRLLQGGRDSPCLPNPVWVFRTDDNPGMECRRSIGNCWAENPRIPSLQGGDVLPEPRLVDGENLLGPADHAGEVLRDHLEVMVDGITAAILHLERPTAQGSGG
jgi:hypothetical protein